MTPVPRICLTAACWLAAAVLLTAPLCQTADAADWHYRVPIAIPAGASVDSTIRVDVDFAALLTQLGIAGSFDANSPRIVRSGGTLVVVQQFTDSVYAEITDAAGNGRGEVRFILEDAGPVDYYLYFDITANGAKPPWPVSSTINGNFEFSSTGQRLPAGWTATATSGFDAQVRPSEMVSVTTDPTGTSGSPRTTDGTPKSGQYAYLMGARSNNEPSVAKPAVTLTRTIPVPAVNPGQLSLSYRLEGWDGSVAGQNQWDFIRIRLVGASTTELVGPDAVNNYQTLPFAPNHGISEANGRRSGYGQYNGWDTDTGGNHHLGMSLAPGSEPWFAVNADLVAFAGRTIILEITSNHSTSYRSWVHLDDVEWSMQTATLGTPEAVGSSLPTPPAGGNKPLYLRTNTELSRTPPASRSDRRIGRNSSHTWTLTPALAQPLTIAAGATHVPVRLMIRHPWAWWPVTTNIAIELSGIGSLPSESISVDTTVRAYDFLIPLATPAPITLSAGTAPVLTVRTTNQPIRVFTTDSGSHSRIVLDAATVINVDDVAFYDAAYPAGSPVTSSLPGQTVYLRAQVSDPFGSFDITAADMEITGPLTPISQTMTQVHDDGAATKIYEYALILPTIGSDGIWTATVTAREGTENEIFHQETASLEVGIAQLSILHTASSGTAAPGDPVTYTIQVTNTGMGRASTVQLDDALSPFTALRIAYDGVGALPFSLTSAPAGLTLGTPQYSDDDGATYTYGPLVSGGGGMAAGHDGNVTHWRLPFSGTLSGGSGFTIKYQVIVK